MDTIFDVIPLGNRVILQVEKSEDKTKGGILLPDNLKTKENNAKIVGTILVVGDGAWAHYDQGQKIPEVGDRVNFSKYAGYVINNDENIRCVEDEDIHTIIRNKE